MSQLEGLLVKLGYSRYALDSDVVTEDMLDQMITANEFANLTDKKPDQPKGFYPICADEKPFVTKPTLLASCN
uniref:Uncharacterized protein n=1 Tax=Caenorhabditis japonica TaxID=281687 RepID=A0A8R1DUS6_CAEJA